jgi:fumarylacetoacetase
MIAYGIFSSTNNQTQRMCARVGDKIIDLSSLASLGCFDKMDTHCLTSSSINDFIRQGYDFRQKIKKDVLTALQNPNNKFSQALWALGDPSLKFHLPVEIGGYTDFYASKQHTTNIGKIFRPGSPIAPNWLHMPIGYNGRASSVLVSGHPVKRPTGQFLSDEKLYFGPCQKLDIEIELGVIIGKDNALGEPISIENAHEYIFGVCIVDDWSARDIQQWEYVPLGPFTSKSFITSISAFIVPIEELNSYKVAAPVQDPKPLSYLEESGRYTYDVRLEARLTTQNYPEGIVVSRTNFKYMYWTMQQWITHHTVTGCNLRVGDLLASGTISGDTDDSFGSFMELTINGQKPFTLPNGEQRTFLEDGDTVIIDGYCGEYHLGSVSGTVVR